MLKGKRNIVENQVPDHQKSGTNCCFKPECLLKLSLRQRNNRWLPIQTTLPTPSWENQRQINVWIPSTESQGRGLWILLLFNIFHLPGRQAPFKYTFLPISRATHNLIKSHCPQLPLSVESCLSFFSKLGRKRSSFPKLRWTIQVLQSSILVFSQ